MGFLRMIVMGGVGLCFFAGFVVVTVVRGGLVVTAVSVVVGKGFSATAGVNRRNLMLFVAVEGCFVVLTVVSRAFFVVLSTKGESVIVFSEDFANFFGAGCLGGGAEVDEEG